MVLDFGAADICAFVQQASCNPDWSLGHLEKDTFNSVPSSLPVFSQRVIIPVAFLRTVRFGRFRAAIT
jgi:hypothetical protein